MVVVRFMFKVTQNHNRFYLLAEQRVHETIVVFDYTSHYIIATYYRL